MEILRLDSTGSTNTWVAEHEQELQSPSLVYTLSQTAGRGQRGNSWESEPGKNITASLIFRPREFEAFRQFRISEAVALSIVDFLKSKGVEASVKWPNDIYVGDKKICGILVEHVVTGKNISRTIAGFGLNLNQEKFVSDAPNPVSLKQLTGETYDIDKSVDEIALFLEKALERISEDTALHTEFLKNLWRKDDKFHSFKDKLKDEIIHAQIVGVDEYGMLTIVTDKGENREFAFKEIEFLL